MRMTEEQYQAYLQSRQKDHQLREWLHNGQAPIAPPAKPQKYRNLKVTDGAGAVHDSRKEYRRWCELELRERAGEIRSLRRQVPYALVVNGVLVCSYVADFVFVEGEATVLEDSKSPVTRKLAAYRIKRKLVQAIYGYEIREV